MNKLHMLGALFVSVFAAGTAIAQTANTTAGTPVSTTQLASLSDEGSKAKANGSDQVGEKSDKGDKHRKDLRQHVAIKHRIVHASHHS